jgi:quinol monooxygenase YgiN
MAAMAGRGRRRGHATHACRKRWGRTGPPAAAHLLCLRTMPLVLRRHDTGSLNLQVANILLIANLHSHPHTADEVAATLCALAITSRAEPGCLSYTVRRRRDQPERFVVCEPYRDQAACDAHPSPATLRQALVRFDALLSSPPHHRDVRHYLQAESALVPCGRCLAAGKPEK